jgi:hypothetical protein
MPSGRLVKSLRASGDRWGANESKQEKLAQSPPRTQRNSPRYEESILPTVHVARLHLRDDPFVGRADSRA